ncbi:beta-ketoacyl synthase N-terminal-like domain-containing protein [Dyadobacter psychrotolerans]|uniref:Beta-ketoacyl synthase n=1 Tax=Dyadobacter psychrotolerans TaxID=2541721 RepID=A0A4R5DEV4_9BACT|nr:beta-ketoacyl synthase N-terminal-like domain-containing protein [Dyadobacter psychrotolerans]TDE10284.1 beta-ketoacyl synthase [Dyadobacter psychrotolerans]
MIYIGAEEIISPLGVTADQNFRAMVNNQSGISLVADAGLNKTPVHLSKITDLQFEHPFDSLLEKVLISLSEKIDSDIITSDRTILLISSTKGAIENIIGDQFGRSVAFIKERFSLRHQPVVISNACISGVLAINAGANFISAGLYDHAIVIGCDLVSDFVLYGFQSLFAISEKPCLPFDSERNGITLGEACSAVLVSNSPSVFREAPLRLLKGTSANDANHISGPSRTGEGLFRSVKKTMEINGISDQDIDFISAHGTATVYNDEMESIAFDRLSLTHVPLNSFKGYFGHTLGAAGVIETAVSIQMIRNDILLKSLGFQQKGTSVTLNIIEENKPSELKTILKTASGFGGGNASLIIQKL